MPDLAVHATPPGDPGGEHRPTSATFRRALTSHPDEMAQTIVELHRIVHNEDDLVDLLQRAAQVAVRFLHGIDWLSVTVQLDDTPFTAAHTDERAYAFDERQYALGDGPSLHAMRSGEFISRGLAELETMWPKLAETAKTAGIGSVLAVPLSGMPTPVGSVNVYGTGLVSLDAHDRDFLAVLEEYVNRGMADYAAVRSAEQRADGIREAMRSRAVIEQAKGILMAVHQVSDGEAFHMLAAQSQLHNTKLRDVAAQFVAAHANQPVCSPLEPAGAGSLSDFHSAFDHSPIGAAITDFDGHFMLVNPALERLLDASAGELLGERLDKRFDPGDGTASTALADLRGDNAPTRRRRAQILRSHGSAVPVLLSATAIFAGDGQPSHAVVYVECPLDRDRDPDRDPDPGLDFVRS